MEENAVAPKVASLIVRSRSVRVSLTKGNMRISTCILSCALLFAALWREGSAQERRETSCDDGTAVADSCDLYEQDTLERTQCPRGAVFALREGCFQCVKAGSCEPIGRLPTEQSKSLSALEKAPVLVDNGMSHVMLGDPRRRGRKHRRRSGYGDRSDHAAMSVADHSATYMGAPQANSKTTTGKTSLQLVTESKPERISVLYYVVPALGSLTVFAIAARRRASQELEFNQLADEEREEINPFCDQHANALSDDESDLEYGHFADSSRTAPS